MPVKKRTQHVTKKENETLKNKENTKETNRRKKCTVKQYTSIISMRKFISVGGWCGPALILGKLGFRTEAYPFDFSRVTLDGILHFTQEGFRRGFFPPGQKPYRPECVGPWVLFRSEHCAFAHFDLNDDNIIKGFETKIRRWDGILEGSQPVTFLRTVAAKNPQEELNLLPQWEEALRQRSPKLDYRVVVVVHDQGLPETMQLEPIGDRVSVWALEYTPGLSAEASLFDKANSGYEKIVYASAVDENWPPRRDPRAPSQMTWRHHTNIALIDGVASVGGTCTGFGSTHNENGLCPYCGNTDYHKAGRPWHSGRAFTLEEDEIILLQLYRIMTGGDRVEAVEEVANQMRRGAFEVICRIQFLTQSSTKITEGLEE